MVEIHARYHNGLGAYLQHYDYTNVRRLRDHHNCYKHPSVKRRTTFPVAIPRSSLDSFGTPTTMASREIWYEEEKSDHLKPPLEESNAEPEDMLIFPIEL